ncbi:MacB-like periplasmic core domain protein [Gemmatirosa kalamazoonensis]|uniref:MacB-like periplasmic core domain protein n=1 Tax=Gemmatirosa kalamazoonensis TaxID=861299 RepID=W0RJ27_9BACT|nr:ABC transporter permease [Gemmatirosa kalamazoonensis]AHG90437.1 MacB-like periplasmic core domain protein [Gemmatirosa kalamazoonensis]
MRLRDRLYQLAEGVLIALDAIRANKVRAGLTILGIAVGVFVVTVMSAAVHGINEGVARSIAAAGPTSFFLTRWPAEINSCNGSADSCPWRRFPPLTIDEARRIERLPTVGSVVSEVGSSARVRYADRELPSVGLTGYSPAWLDLVGGDIVEGRNITSSENEAGARVVLVNPPLKERLFAGGEAVGKDVRLNGELFRVVGVYQPLPNAFENGDKGRLIVPLETARRRLQVDVHWLQISVKPRPGVARDAAIDEVLTMLRAERHLHPGSVNNFFVSTPEKILELYNKIVGAFFLVMIVLSAVGLLVGGVGVVAIMMISVTERTREIGVRKALGATRATILWQFLVEAATLTSVGAVSGLSLGVLLAYVIRHSTPIQASVPSLAIVAALAASALTGIAFGLLPAARAARLDPVEALRFE